MKKQRQGLILGVLAIFILTGLLLGCGKAAEPTKPAAPAASAQTAKVSVGILKLTSTAPIFIGMEKGYFKEQGIEIEPQWFDAAHPIAVATASNKVQVGATGITASLFWRSLLHSSVTCPRRLRRPASIQQCHYEDSRHGACSDGPC